MLYTVFLAATLLLVVLTLLPLWRVEYWMVRVLDFPRLQLFSLALLLLVLELLLLEPAGAQWALPLAALACALYQGWWILPYTPLVPVEVRGMEEAGEQQVLKLLTANVLGSNRDAESLLAEVRRLRPDLLLTLESTAWWEEQLDVLEDEYPYTVKCALENLYGMHLYSRLPLRDSRLEYLLEEKVPSIHTFITLPDGSLVGAHFLHPSPPVPPYSEESSERDAELLVVGRRAAEAEGPIVVAGDLNDVAWSPTTRLFRKISGLLDPRIGRGMFNTFHAQHWYLRWPLDHLFHSGHFRLKTLRRLDTIGSDHFPLYSELVYLGAEEDAGRAPRADAEDAAEAREKMADEGVDSGDVPDRDPNKVAPQ